MKIKLCFILVLLIAIIASGCIETENTNLGYGSFKLSDNQQNFIFTLFILLFVLAFQVKKFINLGIGFTLVLAIVFTLKTWFTFSWGIFIIGILILGLLIGLKQEKKER